jgi:hypothetical protein
MVGLKTLPRKIERRMTMPLVKTAEKTMSMSKIIMKARNLGIDPTGMKKTDLIHSIQRAENYTACFGTAKGQCVHTSCCFMDDCLKIK